MSASSATQDEFNKAGPFNESLMSRRKTERF